LEATVDYTKAEAKSWAHAHMRGACNVIIPSYTSDLRGLNEAGIRHDVRHNIELGFWGTLLVSEAGTTHEEYKQFLDIAADEAKGRHHLVVHGTFDTADDIVEMANYGERAGMSALLLGYPNSFYPKSSQDVYDFTAYVCERTNLATILFAATHWNFGRLSPTGFPIDVLLDAVKLPNVVACKHEAGGTTASYEFFRKAKDSGALLSDPFEQNSPLWVDLFGMQWMGTRNYEYVGGKVPEYFAMLSDEGASDQAMELYWKLQPARAARLAEHGTFGGANFIHRYLWKFQAWLNGYNGGPIRQPAMKLNDGQMRRIRDSLTRSGLEPEMADFSEFFVGRNPA
jgi:4-hydroxy-tetrahydrodipicolinate synthase